METIQKKFQTLMKVAVFIADKVWDAHAYLIYWIYCWFKNQKRESNLSMSKTVAQKMPIGSSSA
jgi:hypothetical protein